MRLPSGDRARIDRRKITDYLLSGTHPVGRHKRRYFESAGFSSDRPDELVAVLVDVARKGTVSGRLVGSHGVRYIVDGTVRSPNGASFVLRTIWVMQTSADIPHFVTAYPHRA